MDSKPVDRPDGGFQVPWAACGAIVVGYILLVALGAFEPEEAIELTIVVVALAGVLLAHEWRKQFRSERR